MPTPTRFSFTVERLANLTCPPSGRPGADGRVSFSDSKVPGLVFRISENGARAFYWYRKVNGRPRRVRLGTPAEINVEQARRRAGELNSKLATGEDPSQAKRTARAAAALADLWAVYLTTYAIPHKKASSMEEDKRNWAKHLEPWGKFKRLDEITQADVKTLHTRIGSKNGKYAANRVLALLSGMFSKSGADLGFDVRNNPARGVTRFEEKERDRVLRADEVQALLAAIEHEDATIRDFIKVSLFTGARRANVLSMKWDDVSIPRGEWTVAGAETKNGDPMKIALAPAVVDILKKRADDSPYVFPAQRVTDEQVQAVKSMQGTGATTREIADRVKLSQTTVCRIVARGYDATAPRHLSPPRKAWEAVLEAAGIKERTTLHDLRRSFASALINSGANLTTVAAALGHHDVRTTQKHYAIATGATVRNATMAGVDALLGATAPKEDKPAKSA